MKNDRWNRKVLAWALYDWANSAFATTVMAGFFPIFFKQYWSASTDPTVSTFQLGTANSIAGILVAVLAPVLGAMADRAGARKRFLLGFALLGALATGLLWTVSRGDWPMAAAFYVLGIIGFSGANIFYDSLLVHVAPARHLDFVSALGFSLGYLGGGVLFALNAAMTLSPQTFGLADASEAVRLSFLSVAVWWALFSMPLAGFIHEPRTDIRPGGRTLVREGFTQVAATFRKIRDLRVVFLFLVGYWLYIDGVDTIIRMAVDYGMSLGFSSKSLIQALLITQFVGFPAALLFGRIGEKLGPKTGIYLGIAVYLGVTVWGYFMDREVEFYLMAGVIGLVQGGVQSLSRSLYARIIPPHLAAEFFGFYNLLGKFAAVLGPFLMGWVGMATGNPRLAILVISVLFIAGGAVLYFVDEREGERLARSF